MSSEKIKNDKNANRSTTPVSEKFRNFIMSNWDDSETKTYTPKEFVPYTKKRREKLSEAFIGKRLVIAAGELKQRSNDCDYAFRPHTIFTYLSAWGSDTIPGSYLVFEPKGSTHEITLYFRESSGKNTEEFFADAEIGEFWIGPRPTLEQISIELGITSDSIKNMKHTADDITLENSFDLLQHQSEARLIKDDYEISQMRKAVNATELGFNDIVSRLPEIIDEPRGERIVESLFNSRARLEGNSVGYDTIAAAGNNACVLHWTKNDGSLKNNELILVDAGVEVDSLYTADITRTIPSNGKFTDIQAKIYNAVKDAADEAFAIVKPGITFRDIHHKAMQVIAKHIDSWGLIPENLRPDAQENQYYRRYMIHGTSHHLGIDVHDCSQARKELYIDGVVQAGMIFTIEPGLYFHANDLSVPKEYRGIGIRIEDDILVTENGAENLSAGIPRSVAEVENWVARLAAK